MSVRKSVIFKVTVIAEGVENERELIDLMRCQIDFDFHHKIRDDSLPVIKIRKRKKK